jgi:hypothetical protein
MIIYDKAGLANLHIQEQAEQAHDAGLVEEAELNQIKLAYPTGFYTPNLFVRIGLFLLTSIGSLFAGLFVSLILEDLHVFDTPVWPMLLGLCSYAASEFFTKHKRLFRSGIEDALLWLSATLLTVGIIWALDNSSERNLLVSCAVLLLSLYFTLRFADPLMAVIALLSLLATVFFIWNQLGSIGEATMPFVIMIVSFFACYRIKAILADVHFITYRDCLVYAQITSLSTLYFAGNYFAVQKLSNVLHHLPQESNQPLPFGWFFWLYTLLLPLLYVAFGIKKRRLMLLRMGLLLTVAAAFTFRNYYQLLPMEYVLVIAGITLLLIVVAARKYLKTSRLGFTYVQRGSRYWANNINLESIVVAGASPTTAVPVNPNSPFGGGSFGGGGASSTF